MDTWYVATENGQLELSNTVWEWANGVLTAEKISKFFLPKDKFGTPPGTWQTDEPTIDITPSVVVG
jgi:hypothetical protein